MPQFVPHIPVLLNPVLQAFETVCDGVVVDGTFGAGGYTRALLKKYPNMRIIAFDRDETVMPFVEQIKTEFQDRFTFIQDCFGNMALHIKNKVQGIVLDLGVSSMQIDTPERGFSFRFDGPLDMRMGATQVCAADVVNHFEQEKIADILYRYGEEKASRRIARAICLARSKQPIQTTAQLAEIIHQVMPRPKDGADSAARSFQALRIFVNDELGELERALEASNTLLSSAGRLAVVTFHSLEDRLVKNFLTKHAQAKRHVNKYASEHLELKGDFKIITSKPVVANADELRQNPRANCAKLRIGEKI